MEGRFLPREDPKRRHIPGRQNGQTTSESIKSQVEFLITAKITGTAPSPETSQWAASREAEAISKARQSRFGSATNEAEQHVAAFWTLYEGRTDVKPNTRAHLKRARTTSSITLALKTLV